MRILFLDQFSEMGGAQRGLLDIVSAAQERGWTARVAIPGNGPLVEHLRKRDVGVTAIPCGPYRSGSKSISDLTRFAADVREQTRIIRELAQGDRFDLVYVNGPRVLPSAVRAVKREIPVLFHAHSRIPAGVSSRLIGWSLKRVDAVIACSNYVARPLREADPRVVPNGVQEIPFRERGFDANQELRIGLVGRISPQKGQAAFVQAAKTLAPEFPHACFVICGAPLFGETEYFEAVRQSAQCLPVEFIPWQDDVASVFAGLDLLVVPSRDEGMGRIIVEAFSAGVPVVAFSEGGIPEVVTDNVTGFLTSESTHAALVIRIREVLTAEPAFLRRIVANARREWERSYTVAQFQHIITNSMAHLVAAWQTDHGKEEPQPYR